MNAPVAAPTVYKRFRFTNDKLRKVKDSEKYTYRGITIAKARTARSARARWWLVTPKTSILARMVNAHETRSGLLHAVDRCIPILDGSEQETREKALHAAVNHLRGIDAVLRGPLIVGAVRGQDDGVIYKMVCEANDAMGRLATNAVVLRDACLRERIPGVTEDPHLQALAPRDYFFLQGLLHRLWGCKDNPLALATMVPDTLIDELTSCAEQLGRWCRELRTQLVEFHVADTPRVSG